MKKLLLPLVLVLCLLLAACGNNHTESENNNSTDDQVETNQPVEPVEPDDTDTPEDEGPVTLGALTVEVVMDWDSADALLSQLEDLSAKLDEALVAQGYDAESITVTVSTAGGTTADALAAGGVDIALLPAEDFVLCEDSAVGILMTDSQPPAGVIAVTKAKAELDEAFQQALSAALTDGGEESFTEHCYPSVNYIAFDSDALQPVRDQLAEEGHSAAEE